LRGLHGLFWRDGATSERLHASAAIVRKFSMRADRTRSRLQSRRDNYIRLRRRGRALARMNID